MDCCERGLQEILARVSEEGTTPACLQILTVLLPKSLIDRAMRLIANKASIKQTIARTSRRTIWTVAALKQSYYVFLTPVRYCSCMSFAGDVILRGRFPLCKHILAVAICDAQRDRAGVRFRVAELDDAAFSEFVTATVFLDSAPPRRR
jgi:predicted nucleic acid-binding Zn finger protein